MLVVSRFRKKLKIILVTINYMFCENCGNKIQDGYKFCTKCGNSTISNSSKSSSRLNNNEVWWIRLLKVLYIIIHIPLLVILPIVWSTNTESCYYYSCSGSNSQAFWYSLLTLVIYIVIIRLIKLATIYIAIGRKPEWKKEFKKLF